MRMCELKDGDCFYVPCGNWYGNAFEKDGVLYYNVNYNEDYMLGNCDAEVVILRPRRQNIEWKLKQLGFEYNEYDDCNYKILTINGRKYKVYVDDDLVSELSFYVHYANHFGCEENTFRTQGFINHLNDIDGLYYAFETMCKELAEYDLICEHEDVQYEQ